MTLPIVLLALTAAPQSDLIVDWDRRFQDPGSSVEIPSSAVALPDGGVILTEGGVVFPGDTITRLDGTGATVWETDLFQAPSPYVIVGADTDGAGGVVVMATRFGEGPCFAFRHDANGGLVWSTEIEASTTGFPASVIVHDAVGDGAGGIVGVGNEFVIGQGFLATIFHVDAAGNEVARVTPVGASLPEYFAIDRAPNGDYAIATSLLLTGSNFDPSRTEVSLFDSQFNPLWRRELDPRVGIARNVGFGGSGQVYVGYNGGGSNLAEIFALDRADGSSLWQATVAASTTGSRVRGYAPAQGGGVHACGWAASGSERRGLIQRFSASGEAGPARLFGEGTADRNELEFNHIVRRGEGLLAIGEAEETVNFPFSETTEGVAMAFLPEFGESYCGPAVPNSTGAPAVITAHGDDAAAGSNGLVLRAQGIPPGMTTLFIVGSQQGTIPIFGNGQGIICLGGLLGRYSSQVGFARPDGVSEIVVNPASTPTPAGPLAIAAGQTWNFQVWYRDSNPMPTSNASDAVAVTFD